jgi:hypothetical protein
MHREGRISTARLREIFPSYIALCEEHLALAKAFAEELTADVAA